MEIEEVLDEQAEDVDDGQTNSEEDNEDGGEDNGSSDPDSINDSDNYSLAQISQLTGIPAITLSRYARENAGRLHFEGKGKYRRYSTKSIKVFEKIREEAMKRRGRPKGTQAVKRGRKATPGTTAAAPGVRRGGRPRKMEDTPVSVGVRRRGRPGPRRRPIDQQVEQGRRPVTQSPPKLTFAGDAFKSAHLLARLSAVEDIIAMVEQERANIKRELDSLV